MQSKCVLSVAEIRILIPHLDSISFMAPPSPIGEVKVIFLVGSRLAQNAYSLTCLDTVKHLVLNVYKPILKRVKFHLPHIRFNIIIKISYPISIIPSPTSPQLG